MHLFTTQTSRWMAVLALLWVVGCKKSSDPIGPANQDCQLQSSLLTVGGNSGRSATAYSYNGNGQLVSSVNTTTLSTGTASSGRTTVTYAYDGGGNLTSAVTQGTSASLNSTVTYEYTNGRLTKETDQDDSGTIVSTYTYDASGRLATYTEVDNTGSQPFTERYTYTNGELTAGTISSGSQSATVTVSSGRITRVTYPGNTQLRYTYDANGYQSRYDVLIAGTPSYYIAYEYGQTSFLTALPRPTNAPATNLYGKSELPVTRLAYYENNALEEDYRLQYQVNSKNYLTNQTLTVTASGRTSTQTLLNTYTNCQ